MSDFQRVKEAYPLTRYAARRGWAPSNKNGSDVFVNPSPCCGHKDCFHITPGKEVWKCFSCDRGGDVFDLHMILDGLEKGDALRELAEEAGVTLSPRSGPSASSPALTGKQAVWAAAVDIFHAALLANEAMIEYQKTVRGHELATLKRFRVGWADGRLRQALADRGIKPGEGIKSGVLLKAENGSGETTELFRDCFVYPSFDADGRPLHFRCKFPKPAGGGKPQAGYQLPSEYRHKDWVCWNQGALGRHDEIVVCEGENDLLTWVEAGIPNVVATCGGPSKEQLNFFVKHHASKTWLLAYDNDDAGASFVERFAKTGMKVKVLEMEAV